MNLLILKEIDPHLKGASNHNYLLVVVNKKSGVRERVGVIRRNRAEINISVSLEDEIRMLKLASSRQISPKFLFQTSDGFCTKYVDMDIVRNYLGNFKLVNVVSRILGNLNKITISNSYLGFFAYKILEYL